MLACKYSFHLEGSDEQIDTVESNLDASIYDGH